MSRAKTRVIWSSAFVAALILILGAILAVGVILSGLLGEGGDLRPDSYGIATVGGVTSVVICDNQGISSVAIEDNRNAVVWSATADGSAQSRSIVAISADVPGYRIDGQPPSPDAENRLSTLVVDGRNVLVTEPTFTSAQIPEGSVRTGSGAVLAMAEFKASNSDCTL